MRFALVQNEKPDGRKLFVRTFVKNMNYLAGGKDVYRFEGEKGCKLSQVFNGV